MPSCIDPGSNAWLPAGSMSTVRKEHTTTLLPSGKVLVAGGEAGVGGDVASADLYDPSSNSWTAAGSMDTRRAAHTATLLPSGKVLVAGDLNGGNVLAGAELYDPGSNTWSTAETMSTAHAYHTATLLPSGKVLVTGGSDGTSWRASASAELYDPVSNTWSTAGMMGVRRSGQAATLLPSGKVLVAGGEYYGQSWTYLTDAELYDPANNTWSQTGSMNAARVYLTATLLPSGKVLVAGGAGTSTELFSPGKYVSAYLPLLMQP